MTRFELLIGCGHQRKKLLVPPGSSQEWDRLTTLDNNQRCNPDVVCNLEAWDWEGAVWNREHNLGAPYFFGESIYDEVHAYEVLEHLGQQGEAPTFFNTFRKIWSVLKPNGYLCATVPSRYSPWLWGDPGHRRAILPETLFFLDQTHYAAQLGKTALSDYRDIWKGDFNLIKSTDDRVFHSFILQAVKPSRIGMTDGGVST